MSEGGVVPSRGRPEQLDRRKQFDALTSKLLAELDYARCSTNHDLTLGMGAERVLATFLRDHLPGRFSVSTGQVVAPDGALSRQHDVIIHEAETFPPASVNADGSLVVLAHAVYAATEVKATLRSSDVENVFENARRFREVTSAAAANVAEAVGYAPAEKGTREVPYLLFALRSELGTDRLIDLSKELAEQFKAAGLCVLDVIHNDPQRRTGLLTIRDGVRRSSADALALFMNWILELLYGQSRVEPGDLRITAQIVRGYLGAWPADSTGDAESG